MINASPTNPTTSIDYYLEEAGHVTIEVFNSVGQKVRTLVDADKPRGPHTVEWDATSDDGAEVASGVYLYRIVAGSFSDSKKMTLLK